MTLDFASELETRNHHEKIIYDGMYYEVIISGYKKSFTPITRLEVYIRPKFRVKTYDNFNQAFKTKYQIPLSQSIHTYSKEELNKLFSDWVLLYKREVRKIDTGTQTEALLNFAESHFY